MLTKIKNNDGTRTVTNAFNLIQTLNEKEKQNF